MSETVKVPKLKFKKGELVKRDVSDDNGDYRIQGVLVEPSRDKWYYTVSGGKFDGVKIFGKSQANMRFNKVSDDESLIAGKEYEIEKPDLKFDKRETVKIDIDGDDSEYRVQGVLVAPNTNKWFYTIAGREFDGVRIFSQYTTRFSKTE